MNINMSEFKTKSLKNLDIKGISWKIIESYFKGQHLERLVRHQLESYNNFINYQIKKTIEMFNPVTIHLNMIKPKYGLYIRNDSYF